jgi:hypothetical protein
MSTHAMCMSYIYGATWSKTSNLWFIRSGSMTTLWDNKTWALWHQTRQAPTDIACSKPVLPCGKQVCTQCMSPVYDTVNKFMTHCNFLKKQLFEWIVNITGWWKVALFSLILCANPYTCQCSNEFQKLSIACAELAVWVKVSNIRSRPNFRSET